jgi:hypothetical protein
MTQVDCANRPGLSPEARMCRPKPVCVARSPYVSPEARMCRPISELVAQKLKFVTPDLIGGPCLLPSSAVDTRLRGYDKEQIRHVKEQSGCDKEQSGCGEEQIELG